MNQIEIRESTPGGPIELIGHGATFNEPYEVGSFTETLRPGAFRKTLAANPDVALLINHGGTPLARTSSGTMDVSEDSRGLAFCARLEPSDPDVAGILPKIRRGDLSECSFAFRAVRQSWSEDKTERTIRECSIDRGDISIVTNAANPNATATLRADDLTLEARERIAKRVANVCGTFSTPGRLSVSTAPSRPRRYLEAARARRAAVRSDAHEDGDPHTYTDAEIQAAGEKGEALKKLRGGGYHYPIKRRRDLLAALAAWRLERYGAGEGPAVKAWIRLRAIHLRLENVLPTSWLAKVAPHTRDPVSSVGGQEQ